jgi:CRP-like cAMP-binding protein
MIDYIEQIMKFSIFDGIKKENIDSMLGCIGLYVREYHKGEFILLSNEPIKAIGIILNGTVHMTTDDIVGNKVLFMIMKEGELFGESFACGSLTDSSVSFYAATDCNVLYLPFYKVIHTCRISCIHHHQLTENMLRLIGDKNVRLMEKIEVISKKSLREKILTYLSIRERMCGSKSFEIPLGRIELADYLCADRSALTRELNHMKSEGILNFNKNNFQLL